MIVINPSERIKEKALAVTIGFFDGVHQGHRYLIDDLKRQAALHGLPSGVITFRTHPRAVLQADYQPRLLTTYQEKLYRLSTTGIDYCIVLDFTPDLATLSARDFMKRILSEQLGVRLLLVGYDHRFGHDRSEDFFQYVEYGKENNIQVIQSESFCNGSVQVSSSVIRRLLQKGDVKAVATFLTYPYQLTGQIIAGNKIGRTLGFPTANIQINDTGKVIPAAGVYGVDVLWKENCYAGMLHIGNRPTINKGGELSVEVHILNFEGDIYHDEITLIFRDFIRENVKFDSLEKLRAQLEKDKETISRLINK